MTVTSARASLTHSARVRTLWPTSVPMSQRKATKAARRSSSAGPSRRIRMSRSEPGCSSPRP